MSRPVRFREDTASYQQRARAAVAQWRAEHPQGTPDQMIAAVGPAFDRDYGPALRAFLFVIDKHTARIVTGQAAIDR
jgi:hypothetical protein